MHENAVEWYEKWLETRISIWKECIETSESKTNKRFFKAKVEATREALEEFKRTKNHWKESYELEKKSWADEES